MQEYNKKIYKFYHKNKRMPTFREIARITGLKSTNAVSKLIDKLVIQGIIKKDATGKLIPKRLLGSTKILGTVAAGFPSPAEEELVDTITIDEFLIAHKEATYMLKVSGDSMVEAGIHPGDMVLVERNRSPKEGDIVIAEVDQEWTMKYLRKQNGRMVLEPANKKYKTIIPGDELKIAAVVIAVIRKYH
jgi:SOS regulatory protein LexA